MCFCNTDVNNLMHSNSILKCMHCLIFVKHEYIQLYIMYPSIQYIYFISYDDFVDMYNNLILYMCLYIFVRSTDLNSMQSLVNCE